MTLLPRLIFALYALLQAPSPAVAQPQALGSEQQSLYNSSTWEMRGQNGRRYQISLARPIGPPPNAGYPIYYVMDANIMFGTMVDTVRAAARRPGNSDAIIVGVGYAADQNPEKERAYDLTARLGSVEPTMSGTGGAESFIDFIEHELKPAIESRLPVDKQREALFGHSFGGHFVLYTLVNKPTLFDVYVAASPSIWFENRLLARPSLRKRLGPKLEESGAVAHVLITVGEYEQAPDPDYPPADLAVLLGRGQVSNAQEYAQFLSQMRGIDADLQIIPHEDHGTVIPVAIARAVRFADTIARRPVEPPQKRRMFVNHTGLEIPDPRHYLAMTADQRYALRTKVRRLPRDKRDAWIAEFDRRLNVALTYGEHRRLHEEKEAMDERHGTREP